MKKVHHRFMVHLSLYERRKWWGNMIELTKFNGMKFTINADKIEVVEETPDTVISLTTGKKMIVKETRQEVTDLVIAYKRKIYANL